MKKSLLYIRLFFLTATLTVVFQINLSATTIFQKLYETTINLELEKPFSALGSGYFLCGNEYDSSAFSWRNMTLLKTDSLGIPQWCKGYGTSDEEYANDFYLTSDSCVLMAGSFSYFGIGALEDYYIIKTDLSGNLLWSVAVGGNSSDIAVSIVETHDSGYVIAGNSWSFGIMTEEIYLIKLDINGNKLWSRVIGNGTGSQVKSIKTTFDGGFVLAGHLSSPYNILIVKTDSLGFPQWDRNYHGRVEDWAYDIIQTQDSGFVTIAKTMDGDDATLFKTDKNGNPIWAKILSYNNSTINSENILLSNDNYILIGGNAYDTTTFESKIILSKIDSLGNVIWTNTFGGPVNENEYAGSFNQLIDSTFILLGNGAGFGSIGSYFIKSGLAGSSNCNRSEIFIADTLITLIVDSGITWRTPLDSLWHPNTIVSNVPIIETLLCIGNNVEILSDSKINIDIYPNPFTSLLNIRIDAMDKSKKSINVINNMGKLVSSTSSEDPLVEVSMSEFPAGIYHCIIYNDGKELITKSVIKVVE